MSKGKSRFYHIEPVSQEAIKAIQSIISMAIDSNMIEEADAERALKILTVNPHNRLTVLGKRMARLLEQIEEIKSIDRRIEVMGEQVKEEFEGLKTIIEWNPNWREEGN
jgi:Zn-dependent M32 family carboxypeptidase